MMFAAAGMSAAIALLMLFTAGVISFAPLSALCLFIASAAVWVPVREENGWLFALGSYILAGGLSLLICPTVYAYLYILLFGHFGIVYYYLRRRIEDDLLRWLLMLLYCNLFIALGLALAQYVFGFDVQTLTPNMPVWSLILIIEAGLVVYGILYHFCCDLFDTHARKIILPRR